jgi:hypothetical protein
MSEARKNPNKETPGCHSEQSVDLKRPQKEIWDDGASDLKEAGDNQTSDAGIWAEHDASQTKKDSGRGETTEPIRQCGADNFRNKSRLKVGGKQDKANTVKQKR